MNSYGMICGVISHKC